MVIHERVCCCNGEWGAHSYTKVLVVYIAATTPCRSLDQRLQQSFAFEMFISPSLSDLPNFTEN